MSAVGADSLEFTRVQSGPGGNSPQAREHIGDVTIRLARAEVVSVEIVDSHPGRTAGLVVGLGVLIIVASAAIELATHGTL